MERFWNKVEKQGDGCWNWIAAKTPAGYGMFQVGVGVTRRAHRVAWMLTHGDIPKGIFCLHHCDNRLCVNPEHLYLGTHQDNMNDMAARERAPRGEKHHKSKMTAEKVIELRQQYANGEGTMEQLGLIYGINKASARQIIREIWWRHV